MTLFLVVIIARVCDIQFVKGEKYRKLSEERTVRNDTIFANRGNVYAADGNLLATSMSKYTIRMDVMAVKSNAFEKGIKELANSLSELLGKPSSYYQQKLRDARKRKNRYLLIARNIGYSDYMKMKQFPIFKLGVYRGGFIAEQKTVRAHPIGKIAERTIGYFDYRGEAGIEGAFAEYMKGENGWRLKQKIAKGQWKPINDVNEKEPIDGRDVITTIDVNIQDITHHALLKKMEYFEAEHGSAIVMETATGEIKAISNLGRTSDGKYYEKRNYAVWESHEPGSTFKLASLMVALEDKKIDTSHVFDTEEGKIKVYNSWVKDSKRGGFGKVSMAKAIELSSNVAVVKMVQEAYGSDPSKFVEGLDDIGLNHKTGIEIKGEGDAWYPRPSDENWSGLSLPWMSWGYGLRFTPLQMLTFYNAIANEGVMVKPQIVKEIKYQNKVEQEFDPVVLNDEIASEKTLVQIKDILKHVVERGTAKNIYDENFSMAGKTGTCQTNYWTGDTQYISSFVGFFPVENPKYSCIVVVHKPNKRLGYYGATVAAPVFKEIAQKIYTSTPKVEMFRQEEIAFESLELPYVEEGGSAQKPFSEMPNLKGMAAMDAVALMENMGMKVYISGQGFGKVKAQSVKRGAKLRKGAKITIRI